MTKFLNPEFWFNQRPGTLIPLNRNILIGLIIGFFALAVASFVLKKKRWLYGKLFEKLFGFFSTNAVIGLFLFFCNEEMIPFLSSRFWFALWLIGMAVWLFFIARYALKLPEKKKEIEKEREFQKYIPR